MFRRRGGASAGQAAQETSGGNGGSDSGQNGSRGSGPAVTSGKGRPTPKRSEAERRRRQPITAPSDRRSAYRQARARQRTERTRTAQAQARGDPRALPARDRGPVRALARDYVDARRTISEYYMFSVIVLLILLVIPLTITKLIVYPVILVTMAGIVAEGLITGYRLRKIAAQRFPDETTRGLTMYAAMRALQIRRFRLPKPRLKPGDTF
jgi:Protein of unknown function (DUF3043)